MKLHLLKWRSIFFIAVMSGWMSATVRPILMVIGTRPEAIKMIPLYQAFQAADVPVLLCSTGQHSQLLDDVCTLFKVTPDINLHLMKPGQDLFYLTTSVLTSMKAVITEHNPCLVIVQGDTTTAMASALAALYLKIPVAHVEAGLRSGNIYGPFPEEFNRSCITRIAQYHFAPTAIAYDRLLAEQIDPATVFYTGNPVVDALHWVRAQMQQDVLLPSKMVRDLVAQLRQSGHRIMLMTAHRRESFDGGLDRIFSALRKALQAHPDVCIMYPVHPNPCIKQALARTQLDSLERMVLLPPLVYHDLVYLLDACDGVATDSGGITEEAVSLAKPVLLLRNETDRPEGIASGIVRLVGTREIDIIQGVSWIVSGTARRYHDTVSPYGDGHACENIVTIIQEQMLHAGNG